ncbi:dipeptide ABC transporter ATP-binding protein [Streptacidiphilus jiangxiensis]|uniref:Peptide/nickel transport system ATP-binding protein n=1 Tax=Streptacidiphilus jiangxiensis TaxID=235985 RepID=A0A1H7WQ35_STRJI|nr:ABC transporter ATP-binding protein [Streptacidiphilus jiangxiensis]SEM23345.1 peptide/nickel transport system ATP-binding protein [Streptacidiphilus jiangxiensis]
MTDPVLQVSPDLPVSPAVQVSPVLQVRDLRVVHPGPVTALDGLSFDLAPGQVLGLVGESGSGKSAAALALLGLHRRTATTVTGEILLHRPDRPVLDVNAASDAELRTARGPELAMVFQEPLTSLDPYRRIGTQIATAYRLHTGASRPEARQRTAEVLERVGIDPKRARDYPHQFSGGMRQRVLIAMALALRPRVLVADEPTTALDVTVQAQILRLLDELRAETGMALVLVSHDVGVVGGLADEVVVLRQGRPVERGATGRLLGAPEHPYTRQLLEAVPRLDAPLPERKAPAADDVLVSVEGLRVDFGSVRALRGVDLTVRRGETLGIVGESGSGKSTLGRTLVRLQDPTAGAVRFEGADLAAWRGRELRRRRHELQMVFQDPTSSLNPRRLIGDSVAEPLRVQGGHDEAALRAEAVGLLERVGLSAEHADRYPHQLSGGQRQRAAIARALILRPKLIVCDEPVSALDVTTQAQVVALLRELREEFELTLVFIAHDLAVVRSVSDRVAVMRGGEVVETLAAAELTRPRHEYTRALLDAVPRLEAVVSPG